MGQLRHFDRRCQSGGAFPLGTPGKRLRPSRRSRFAGAGLRFGAFVFNIGITLMETDTTFEGDYGPQRLSVELANICNLHCSYCLRAEENLYSKHAVFFPVELLQRVINEAQETAG